MVGEGGVGGYGGVWEAAKALPAGFDSMTPEMQAKITAALEKKAGMSK